MCATDCPAGHDGVTFLYLLLNREVGIGKRIQIMSDQLLVSFGSIGEFWALRIVVNVLSRYQLIDSGNVFCGSKPLRKCDETFSLRLSSLTSTSPRDSTLVPCGLSDILHSAYQSECADQPLQERHCVEAH